MTWRAVLAGVVAVVAVGVTVATKPGRSVLRAAYDLPAAHRVAGHRATLLAAAAESGLDPYLLAGVMYAESSGRVEARSHKGALGLFQLMPGTASDRAAVLGLPAPTEEQLLSDPLLNARLGADYLAWLLDRSGGDVERALVAYNAGPARVGRWIEEAGSWEAWRDARRRAGDSSVLAYADVVERWRERFRARGVLDPDEAATAR